MSCDLMVWSCDCIEFCYRSRSKFAHTFSVALELWRDHTSPGLGGQSSGQESGHHRFVAWQPARRCFIAHALTNTDRDGDRPGYIYSWLLHKRL